jgi:hypothetical protein
VGVLRSAFAKCVASIRTAMLAGFVLAGLSGTAAATCSFTPASPSDIDTCVSVSSFSPIGGAVNTGVTILGFRFKQFSTAFQTFDVTVTSVKIAGVEANSFSVVSDNQIVAIAGDPGGSLPPPGVVEVTATYTSTTRTIICTSPCGPFTAQSAGTFTYETVMKLAPSAAIVSGNSYSQDNIVSGGTGPYTFTKVNGSLPPGTSLSPNGVPTPGTTATVSGTLTSSGAYSYTIKVTDFYGQETSALV